MSFGTPYRPQSNGLCERQNKSIVGILRVLMSEQKTSDWLKLLPLGFWMLNNQHVGSTSCTLSERFLGRPGRNLLAPNRDAETGPTVNRWLEHQVSLLEITKKNLQEFRAGTLQRKNRRNSAFWSKVDDLVVVHKNQIPNSSVLSVVGSLLDEFVF